MKGWISLHRKLQENPIWTSEPFTRGQAWVDLLLLANHERGYIYVRDHKIEIKRGQVGWSQNKLAGRWQWSRTKVRTFLSDLEKEQQIKQIKSHSYTVIDIINYDEYQAEKRSKRQQEDNSKTTVKDQKQANLYENDKKAKNQRQQKNNDSDPETNETWGAGKSKKQQKNNSKTTGRQQQDTNNNGNNENNGNKKKTLRQEILEQNSDAVEVADYLLEMIVYWKPSHRYKKRKHASGGWCQSIERAMRLDDRTKEQLIFVINYLFKQDYDHGSDVAEFWAKNIQSAHKLRTKFDRLVEDIKGEYKKLKKNGRTSEQQITNNAKQGIQSLNFDE